MNVPPIVISLLCTLWFGTALWDDRKYMDPPYGSAIMLTVSVVGLVLNTWRFLNE